MMASRVAVQGSGIASLSWLFSVGNTLAGVVLSKELVARFPLKKTGFKVYFSISVHKNTGVFTSVNQTCPI